MATLKIPSKTINDNFNLQDFKDDFNALNTEVINWENFKNNGGAIGGDLTIGSGMVKYNSQYDYMALSNAVSEILHVGNGAINGATHNTVDLGTTTKKFRHLYLSGDANIRQKITSETKYLELFTLDGTGVVVDTNGQRFRPKDPSTMKLGDSSWRFTDVYIDGESKTTNGYTKLPNGMILQWGEFTSPSNIASSFVFPIEFPNKGLHIFGTMSNVSTNITNIGVGAIIRTDLNGGKTHGQLIHNSGGDKIIRWTAIGY